MKKVLTYRGSREEVRFGKIFCVGFNYAKHNQEMGRALNSSHQVVFIKPSTTVIKSGEAIKLPPISKNVQHELELVVMIGKSGKHISKSDAYNHVRGYAIGIDVTMRDLQLEAKDNGWPWAIAKGFDTSAPISDLIPRDEVADVQNLDINLWVNGELKQSGNTRDMIFKVDDIIAYLSTYFTLEEGDLIFTGSLEGSGRIKDGDTVKAQLGDDLVSVEVSVTDSVPSPVV